MLEVIGKDHFLGRNNDNHELDIALPADIVHLPYQFESDAHAFADAGISMSSLVIIAFGAKASKMFFSGIDQRGRHAWIKLRCILDLDFALNAASEPCENTNW